MLHLMSQAFYCCCSVTQCVQLFVIPLTAVGRPPRPSASPRVCSSSCSLHWWCCPAISSSDTLFSFCPQSFPTSETFPVSHLFASDDQNSGASASESVLPVNIQGWFPLWLAGLILMSKGLSGVFSAPQFKGINSLAFCQRIDRVSITYI